MGGVRVLCSCSTSALRCFSDQERHDLSCHAELVVCGWQKYGREKAAQAYFDFSLPRAGLPESVSRWLALLKGSISTMKSLGIS